MKNEKEVETENPVGYHIIEEERKLLRDSGIVIVSGELDSGNAHEFLEDIYILINKGVSEITVIISSEGGEVDAGLTFIRVIREAQRRGIKVIGSVHGIAMSMALFILQVCDIRKMGDLDILMAHGVTTYSHGDLKNLEEEGKLLKYWKVRFSDLLASRSNKSKEFWSELLDDNKPNYYTSEESLNMGLIDEVVKS